MFGAYERWCHTTSTRVQYYKKMLETCGMIDDPAEIRKSEDAVKRTISAICNFTNPFTIPDKDHLYNIASGAPVSCDIESDVLRAEAIGKEAKKAFIDLRFKEGSSKELFFEPIKRQKLKKMDSSNKVVKLNASQGKVQ